MKNTFESHPVTGTAELDDLRPAIESLVSRFGTISRLDILPAPQAATRQALCFMRLSSAEQELKLSRALGLGRFGGDLVMVVDMLPHHAFA